MVFTVGHSTRSEVEFIQLLREFKIELLLDVRKIPQSRYNPQFTKDRMELSLPQSGIRYIHFPPLGGLRKPFKNSVNTGWKVEGFRGFADYMQTETFEKAMQEFQDLIGNRVATIMCAEAVPLKCHRRLLSDAIQVRGIEVVHILGTGQQEPHALTSFARVAGNRITYPSKEVQLDLLSSDS